MSVKLSKARKLSCASWSLEAIKTCPGARAKGGGLVPVCEGCYATTGNYRFPNVKKPRVHNREDWKRDDWVTDMVVLLAPMPFFRWFDSGDVYCEGLASKILEVMKGTPKTKHWLPTRSYKFKKIKRVLTKMKQLPNVAVRYSSDTINKFDKKVHGSVVITSDRIADGEPDSNRIQAHICFAYEQDGKCGDCRDCWDKTIKTIAYPTHGNKMAKVVANARLALTT